MNVPQEFPPISAGVFLINSNVIITGHTNGYVVKWDLSSNSHELLHECYSRVETISYSPKEEFAVGCNSGLLFTFTLSDPKKENLIQKATHDKFSRVWRSTWSSENTLFITSTYGVFNMLQRAKSSWRSIGIGGHSHSIFALATMGEFVASGDYRGRIEVLRLREARELVVDRLAVQTTVAALAWRKDEAFASIDTVGHISYFELDADKGTWKSVFETDTATSEGTSIHIPEDGMTIFAGSHTELIQFDLDSQQIQMIPTERIVAIFSDNANVYVLTIAGLFSVKRSEVAVPTKLVKYQYSKVSLVGHTGAGKTTLCSQLVTGATDGIKSTFGKRVWNWILPSSDDSPERRVVLHDHGGQETVLDTFLPFLTDSDVVMVFYKQTDKTTFEKAVTIRKEVESYVKPRTKIFLVQTHIDDPMNEIDEREVESLRSAGKIIDRIEVCPPSGGGITDFKEKLGAAIEWDNSRTMMRSEYVENLGTLIGDLYDGDTSVISFEDLRQKYQITFGQSISRSHLKFLLLNYVSQGLIEYYPEVIDSVIFNDERYNELRSKVPILVEQNKGIISINEIASKFPHQEYIRILDQVYLKYGIAIGDAELRIFPERLKPKIENIAKPYITFLQNSFDQATVDFQFQDVKMSRLLGALAELNLRCIDASKTEGLFTWETNACIYFHLEEAGDAVSGRRIRCSYTIGGEKEAICDRLSKEFDAIIIRLFGPALPEGAGTKKKDLIMTEFDVALSFAGEQRGYVLQVANILEGKGIKVFYDEFYESQLWGTDLTEYLQQVYYNKSRWCIMFISKEYVSKMFPTHERKNAVAKDVELKGGYILPVRFDDTLVPGLVPTIGYQNATKKTPEQIATLFIEKFEAM